MYSNVKTIAYISSYTHTYYIHYKFFHLINMKKLATKGEQNNCKLNSLDIFYTW